MFRSHRTRLGLVATAVVAVVGGIGAAGLTAYADETTGTLTGHFTHDGAPVSPGSVFVTADQGDTTAGANLDSDGAFTVADLPPGQYRVLFHDDTTGLSQYAHQKLSYLDADLIDVTAGATTTVDEATLPTGTLQGMVTDAGGAPDVADVQVHLASDPFGVVAFTTAGADGLWQLEVPAADYTVSIVRQPDATPVSQWLHHQVSGSTADTFTVTAGATHHRRREPARDRLPLGPLHRHRRWPGGRRIGPGP